MKTEWKQQRTTKLTGEHQDINDTQPWKFWISLKSYLQSIRKGNTTESMVQALFWITNNDQAHLNMWLKPLKYNSFNTCHDLKGSKQNRQVYCTKERLKAKVTHFLCSSANTDSTPDPHTSSLSDLQAWSQNETSQTRHVQKMWFLDLIWTKWGLAAVTGKTVSHLKYKKQEE